MSTRRPCSHRCSATVQPWEPHQVRGGVLCDPAVQPGLFCQFPHMILCSQAMLSHSIPKDFLVQMVERWGGGGVDLNFLRSQNELREKKNSLLISCTPYRPQQGGFLRDYIRSCSLLINNVIPNFKILCFAKERHLHEVNTVYTMD